MKITATTALLTIAALQSGAFLQTGTAADNKGWHSQPAVAGGFSYTLAAACSGPRTAVDISHWSWAYYHQAGDLFRENRVDNPSIARPSQEPVANQHAPIAEDLTPQGNESDSRNEIDVVDTYGNDVYNNDAYGESTEAVDPAPKQPLIESPKDHGLLAGASKPAEFRRPIAALVFGTGLIALAGLILQRKKI